MSNICKNCNNSFEGNYCNNCGQSKKTHRITYSLILSDLQNGLLSFDKGFLFTLIELFTRPGYAIKEYVKGKRVQHYKPISLLIILSALYILLKSHFQMDLISNVETSAVENQFLQDFSVWLKKHYTLSELIYIPLFSSITFLIFYKNGYNFLEHIIINCFIASQRIFVKIVLIFFSLLFETFDLNQVFLKYALLFEIILVFWTFNQLYKDSNWFLIALKTLVSFILLISIFGVLIYSFFI